MSGASLYAFWAVAAAILVTTPLRRDRRRPRTTTTRNVFSLLRWVAPLLIVVGAVAVHARLRSLLTPHAPGLGVGFDLLFLWSALASLIGETVQNPGIRSRPLFRLGVRLPGQVFVAGAIISSAWLLLMLPVRGLLSIAGAESWLVALRWADWVPVVIAVFSAVTSARRPPVETVHISLGKDGPDQVTPIPVERRRQHRSEEREAELRIVQITDPHLGVWQPVGKLQRHIESLLEHDPHLVLLTGDYLTAETNRSPEAFAEALAPLRAVPGRCYAIFGNHDHEAPATVRFGLAANDITLLVDQETVAQTEVGPVQLIGADFVRGPRLCEHLRDLLARHPRRSGHPRILMLHDPTGFREIPIGEADLTLSGHTHGGHVGWVGLGIHWTVVQRFGIPDQGLFAHGSNRLYVHRGTGFYGFPLRVGVPHEASILRVSLDPNRFALEVAADLRGDSPAPEAGLCSNGGTWSVGGRTTTATAWK